MAKHFPAQTAQVQTVTLPRELAESAADTLWYLKRFTDHAGTIAETIKQLPRDSFAIKFQAQMLLDMQTDLDIFLTQAADCCRALNDAVETAEKEAQQ